VCVCVAFHQLLTYTQDKSHGSDEAKPKNVEVKELIVQWAKEVVKESEEPKPAQQGKEHII